MSARQQGFPGPLPQPLPPGVSPASPNAPVSAGAFVAEIRGIKIAENQSPIPQDRFFVNFNYFNNFGSVFNQRDMNGVTKMTLYQELFGFEKTFFQGDASIGFRLPLNSLNIDSIVPGFGGQETALGDLSIFLKYILLETVYSDGDRFFLTTGLNVTPPTGPTSFAGYRFVGGFRNTNIQPFLGYLLTRGKFYLQGFTSVDVPVGTGDDDVTLLFNDVSLGYFIYSNRGPGRLLTALAPTMEVHVNTPLNHRGITPTDPASTPDTVNMTFGLNAEFVNRAIFTFGYATPVSGPNVFESEFIFQLNIFFGGRGRNMGAFPFNRVPPVL